MTQGSSQKRMAAAIADAVVEYLREYERKMGADSGGAGCCSRRSCCRDARPTTRNYKANKFAE